MRALRDRGAGMLMWTVALLCTLVATAPSGTILQAGLATGTETRRVVADESMRSAPGLGWSGPSADPVGTMPQVHDRRSAPLPLTGLDDATGADRVTGVVVAVGSSGSHATTAGQQPQRRQPLVRGPPGTTTA